MLSILIPTYNRTGTYVLVKTLAQQCATVDGLEWEIIVLDDASTDASAVASNRWLGQIEGVRLIECESNMGRAAIRNRAIREAKGEWVIVLDDDVMPVKQDFIERYNRLAVRNKYDVVCGGVNALHKKEDETSLRWIYDAYAEERLTLEMRRMNPFDCFTTQNFMARRSIFDTLQFDESLKQYGYEDALLGIQMQQQKLRLRHTNNPVEHLGMEPNDVFVKKSEQALQNLKQLGAPMTERARVAVTAEKLRSRHLLWAVKAWHWLFGRLERYMLCSKFPSVHVFQLYKLGYYASL